MDRLTEMEAFATVVDQGGFTDAAKKMGISKSAVSKHVSALEARLGARLLNRTTRRVSPTEIGLAYYDRARRVLNDAGEADALVTSMQSARPEIGMFSLYVPSSVRLSTLREPLPPNGRFSIQMYSPSLAMRWNDEVALLAASE